MRGFAFGAVAGLAIYGVFMAMDWPIGWCYFAAVIAVSCVAGVFAAVSKRP